MDTNTLASQINAVPKLKAGTLRFWGEWFGRPGDNYHTVVSCRAEGTSLVLDFDGAEILVVRDPDGVQFGADVFLVASASFIRWEWFDYGRPHTLENCYFYEFIREESGIIGSTNFNWYAPRLAPSPIENAVEIL
jgi:hypothetical protein